MSYVRWMGKRVVTASVDSSLAWWDLAPSADTLRDTSTRRGLAEQGLDPTDTPTGAPLKIRAFRGHSNVKNFAGLAVRESDGLLACGSECGSAYVYHRCWSSPLASLPVGWPHGPGAGTPPALRCASLAVRSSYVPGLGAVLTQHQAPIVVRIQAGSGSRLGSALQDWVCSCA